MTNEEVLKDFLRSEGPNVAPAFIEGLTNNTSDMYAGLEGTSKVSEAIEDAFDWESTEDVTFSEWDEINDNWLLLYMGLDLSGTIDMTEVVRLIERDGAPIANEKVFVMFLKKHRKYAMFKRNYTKRIRRAHVVEAREALVFAFTWNGGEGGYTHWMRLSDKWEKMCKDLNIQGTIDLVKV